MAEEKEKKTGMIVGVIIALAVIITGVILLVYFLVIKKEEEEEIQCKCINGVIGPTGCNIPFSGVCTGLTGLTGPSGYTGPANPFQVTTFGPGIQGKSRDELGGMVVFPITLPFNPDPTKVAFITVFVDDTYVKTRYYPGFRYTGYYYNGSISFCIEEVSAGKFQYYLVTPRDSILKNDDFVLLYSGGVITSSEFVNKTVITTDYNALISPDFDDRLKECSLSGFKIPLFADVLNVAVKIQNTSIWASIGLPLDEFAIATYIRPSSDSSGTSTPSILFPPSNKFLNGDRLVAGSVLYWQSLSNYSAFIQQELYSDLKLSTIIEGQQFHPIPNSPSNKYVIGFYSYFQWGVASSSGKYRLSVGSIGRYNFGYEKETDTGQLFFMIKSENCPSVGCSYTICDSQKICPDTLVFYWGS
jgi:hypothetical protein